MSEFPPENHHNPSKPFQLQFGAEIEMEASGYAFRPIADFELEIDGSIYMYSEDGSFEIHLVGGKLQDDTSIAVLNDELIGEFMENVDHYELVEMGKNTLQGITSFVNEIRFFNVEEEGVGRALICSPFINQYFFMLVIAAANDWQLNGEMVFNVLKNQIHFHPQFKSETIVNKSNKHPDLTIETYENLAPDEDFFLTIEKGDVSVLLAARSASPNEEIWISEITAPDGTIIYGYDEETGEILSAISHKLLSSLLGEVCLFLPSSPQSALQTGDYRFTFDTQSKSPLQEVQVVIRSGRALDLQDIDINFWAAVEDNQFTDSTELETFEKTIFEALKEKLKSHNLTPGKITTYHPAPDELTSFSSLNLNTDLPDCSYMVTESIENMRALNIALVRELTQGDPPTPSLIKAISSGSPGMIMTSASPQACIVIEWPRFAGDPNRLAEAIIQNLVIFSGIDLEGTGQENLSTPVLNREVAWRLRRHPLFYDAD